MAEVKFVFCVHDHQPVGNFGHVFEKAFDTCYQPFFDILADYPMVRVGMHISGPLLEWIDMNRPAFFATVRGLAARGQIEMLAGGFYEPMLSVLPDRDVHGQIAMMRGFIKDRFGQEATGMWLTERVWEPDIPRMLDGTGIEYTFLDDAHFSYAGMGLDDLHGYYVTDKAGKVLSVFPISQRLRYMIPFKPVEEVVGFFRDCAARGVDGLTYGDDGEKFGLWPGTREWVLEKGWLRRFFQAMSDNADWVKMVLPGEFTAAHQPAGRVYLPTASYEEMMEWSLPAGEIPVYDELRRKLGDERVLERYRSFVRGGIWQNFFVKYPEANRMYRRMLRLSEEIDHEATGRRGKPPKALETARRELYRSQCNCAYWHGLFGGLYLNYLRHAIYTSIINGDNALGGLRDGEWARSEIVDLDDDLCNEAELESRSLRVVIRPQQGGAVEEIDLKSCSLNVTNVLTRRREGYHRRIIAASHGGGDQGAPQSIHDIVRTKEDGLEGLLVYDRFDRMSFVDHVIGRNTDIVQFQREQYEDLGTLSRGKWTAKRKDQTGYASVKLVHEGRVMQGGMEIPVLVEKTYTLHARNSVMSVSYRIQNCGESPIDQMFAPELNLSLLACDDPKRRLVIPGSPERVESFARPLTAVGLNSFSLRDEWFNMRLDISFDPIAEMWHYPVETVSQSEDGFERTYQGSAFVLVFPLVLVPGASCRFNIQMTQEQLLQDAGR
ncbi:MAG: alpha-amylase/4-alpha-glucanotransferase domain-containing protein [Myxococcota bacterium]|jgi:alpha-amylase